MRKRVLVLGWSFRNSEYYVRLLQEQGDEREFVVRSMEERHVRGLDSAAWAVILLGPVGWYESSDAVEKVRLALLHRRIEPVWDSTDRLLGVLR